MPSASRNWPPATDSVISGVILAGGNSRRMGQDKRFLTTGGVPLLVNVITRLRPLVAEVILVANDPERLAELEARVVGDRYPGRGVLAGVHAGLLAARGEWAFIVAADMPFLSPALLTMLQSRAGAACDVVIPRWQGELEPLHALYRPARCAKAAEAALLQEQRRIVAFFPQVRVCLIEEPAIRRVDPEGRAFFNVNTPEDWAAACRLRES